MADIAPGLVTVFGGSGFIGSQVVRALAKRGWRVRAAVRKPNLAFELKPLGDVGQIQAVRCDITDPDQVAAALKGADAAINLVGVLYETPGRSFEKLHVEGARIVAEAAKAAKLSRLVQVSAIGADKDSASSYARTKAEGEAAVKAAFKGATIVRPSVVFGPGDGLLNRFASLATFAPALPLIDGGQTRFQPVYVGDLAEAIARALVGGETAGQTYEIGGPSVMTYEDLLKLVLRETGRNRLLLPLPGFIARPIGSLAQLSALVFIPPVLTRDQVELLATDNVVSPDAKGLADLGIEPTGLDAIAPSYLWRYRVGGQFAANPAR